MHAAGTLKQATNSSNLALTVPAAVRTDDSGDEIDEQLNLVSELLIEEAVTSRLGEGGGGVVEGRGRGGVDG